MADSEQSAQERTLEPTQKRLEDARREGQVPRSRELAHLLVLGAAAGALFLLAAPLLRATTEIVGRGLTFNAALATDPSRMANRLGELAGAGLLAIAPLLAVALVAALAAPLSIGGWIFAPQNAAPKLDRLNPLTGIGRMFSLPALMELVKVLLVTALLAAVGGWYVVSHLDSFATLAHESLHLGLAHFGWLLAVAFALLVATLALTSAIDVPFQLFHFRSKLKMTLEEVKKEQKETEGDPYIKGRIRQQQREMARRRMMAAVPKADVVVTNPTHFAVALKYLEGRHRAPVVVAKGVDEVAERIKALAAEHGVPRLEAPPLARALYRHVELGAEIPAALYTAVAQVLAYVFQLRRHQQGQAPRPRTPDDIEVPEGMDPMAPMARA
ncbi:MAG: flagellar type III secretion system protein FlhB [Burkholderiales bacterium]|jgi:flagellar biosynthetic protein FlhB|nr:flagellar type III secretion system protein FlhB [Burkholderiales bacterium]MCA3216812.1 flagellar type III secretion system protein FlhB [Burkholderiales bacterium]MCA3224070.1 flagellar type III secretion system protein FlhB [Burkholderiales bacterium]MCE2644372.1 flagellar type III secretion system protein FlhB [Burkholderiaceae bacterium]